MFFKLVTLGALSTWGTARDALKLLSVILPAHILNAHQTLLWCISSIVGIALRWQAKLLLLWDRYLSYLNSFSTTTVQDHWVVLIFLIGSNRYLITHVTSAHIGCWRPLRAIQRACCRMLLLRRQRGNRCLHSDWGPARWSSRGHHRGRGRLLLVLVELLLKLRFGTIWGILEIWGRILLNVRWRIGLIAALVTTWPGSATAWRRDRWLERILRLALVSRIDDDLACSLRAHPSLLGCGRYLVFGSAGILVSIGNHVLGTITCRVEVSVWLTRTSAVHRRLVVHLRLVSFWGSEDTVRLVHILLLLLINVRWAWPILGIALNHPIDSILAIARPIYSSRSAGTAHITYALNTIRMEIECLVHDLFVILIL